MRSDVKGAHRRTLLLIPQECKGVKLGPHSWRVRLKHLYPPLTEFGRVHFLGSRYSVG